MSLMQRALACVFVLSLCLSSWAVPSYSADNMPSSAVFSMSSPHTFAQVKAKAVAFIQSKGLTLFAEYDHAQNAQDVKLTLAPTTVLVFGSPAVGTKLMQNFPGIGMELPLKILISQDAAGKVSLAYPNLAHAFAPYGIKKDNAILGKMQGLLEALAKNATQ